MEVSWAFNWVILLWVGGWWWDNQWECSCNFDSQQKDVPLELISFEFQPLRKKDTCYCTFLSNFLEAKSEHDQAGTSPYCQWEGTLLTSTGLNVNSANLFSGHIMPYCCWHQLVNNEDAAKWEVFLGQGKGQGWQGYVNSIPSNGAGVLAITTAVVSVTVN